MSPPSAASWRLAPLVCPRCAGGLEPFPADVAYLCRGCGGASELVDGRTVGRELTWIGGDATERGELALPFWRLKPEWVTPAFNASRLLTLTEWYSDRLAQHAPPHGPAARGLWGGSIGSMDARRVCRMALEASEESDPTCAPELLGIPFRKERNRLVCLATGLHIYFETIEGAQRLMDRWTALSS